MKKKLFGVLCSIVIVLGSVVPLKKMGSFSNFDITASAEENNSNYDYTLLEDETYEIKRYYGTDTEVTIPSTFNGKEVTGIGNHAFYNRVNLTSISIPNSITYISNGAFSDCTNLNNITIPNSITTLGDYAFNDCTSLTSISIPDSVTSIGKGAFWGCTSLTNIAIPNSVKNISEKAFYACKNLTSITIPSSVIYIGNNVFGFCNNLTSINVDTHNLNYSSVEGVLFNKDKTVLIFYPCNKESITIPNSVTRIESNAFDNCPNLTIINIPDSVTIIGDRPFEKCKSLININVDTHNTYFSSVDGVLYNKDTTNLICCPRAKTQITIPDSVTNISSHAFIYCENIKSITLPESITEIGSSAFSDCESLISVNIPDKVTCIRNATFEMCTSLTNITIPNSVTSIGQGAFNRCSNLKNIVIPANVTDIGEAAFGYDVIPVTYPPDNTPGYAQVHVKDFIMKCYSGSAAEKYAKDNGFEYELLDKPDDSSKNNISKVDSSSTSDSSKHDISKANSSSNLNDSSYTDKSKYSIGDVNGDDKIDIEDAVLIINNINGIKPLNDEETVRADIDNNSVIDIEDAVNLIRYIVGERALDDKPKDKTLTGPVGSGYLDYTLLDIDNDGMNELIEVYNGDNLKYRIYDSETNYHDYNMKDCFIGVKDYIVYDNQNKKTIICHTSTGSHGTSYIDINGNIVWEIKQDQNSDGKWSENKYYIGSKQVTKTDLIKYCQQLALLYSYNDSEGQYLRNVY